MKRLSTVCSAVFCLTVLPATGQDRAIALPADPSAVIITADWHDYWSDLRRTNKDPVLTVRADGTVRVSHPQGSGDLSGKLSSSELQDLLNFTITDQNFFAIDVNEISRGISIAEAADGRRLVTSDAAETHLRIQTADRQHEVRFYAVEFYARRFPPEQYPMLKSLAWLRAIDSKLQGIADELRAGGKQAILEALAEANAYLRREVPDAKLFTIDHYRGTSISADGQTRSLTFLRATDGFASTEATVIYRANDKLQVRYTVF